ncbi:3-mercaptopyruvate sulfurtransferase [Pararhizobium mangrovi]|uniref:Sulfurtransferase n=1 Tax=Pararhizobium mangrovi TaxID=2590452 RepID=A0A506UAH9_9HYPH|nr:3-mercaptopyruvate sulfurtransferase [Pararhizobium mangrovi]TPW30376.1 3-mercaptopyruvate sulfurtransferase [Pararhizobium mangrovi]
MSTSPLIDPSTLANELDDPKLVVLDASWYMPAHERDPEAEFEAGHIAGARRFDFDGDVRDPDSSLPHMMPSAERFQERVQALGIDRDSRIVVYDGMGIFAAPRAWWMFKAMGHDDVRVLDGGLPAWKAAGQPVEDGSQATLERGDFVARPDPARIRDAEQVLQSLDRAETVVDARAAPRFTGKQAEPRAGLRSGHMPGARNLPFDRILKDGHYRSPEEIRKAYEEAGVDGKKPIVTTCGSGVTAAVLALGAESAGLGPVAVYDGSWSEWGQETRPELPVVKGEA